MPATASELSHAAAAPTWHDRWVIETGQPRSVDARRQMWRAASGITLSIAAAEGSDLRVAEDATRVVAFAGVLTNAHELSRLQQIGTAQIVLDEFRAHGDAAIGRLRGNFALIAWDKTTGDAVAARDHIGIAPLFVARAGERWAFAASPDVLTTLPEVSREIDAVALSEWLCGWYPVAEDTAYRFVKRLPAATAMRISGGVPTSRRYWDPVPEDGPIAWLGDEEVALFDERLSRAVERATRVVERPPAIFLSGGLDSIAVALTATDLTNARGRERPLALSLVFPQGDSNEGAIQEGVASGLGIEQRLVPFGSAFGPDGLIREALDLTAGWPQPMFNAWAPAYMHLAALGASEGAGVILTGRGGDEWLTVSPYLFADYVGRGDLLGAWRLVQTRRRSNSLRGKAIAQLLWLTAGRPLASAALATVAPTAWHRQRRKKLLAERPGWLAPDPAVRAAMEQRVELSIAPARPKQGFYMREARLALTHAAVSHDMEETQELGRRHGLRVVHPFWDVDLVSTLYRTRPKTLAEDGQFKWLLRRLVAPRLPNLGLERRGKVSAEFVFRGILQREAPGALGRLGGLTSLGRLGVVDLAGIQSGTGSGSVVERVGGASRLWSLLNLETWVRPRS